MAFRSDSYYTYAEALCEADLTREAEKGVQKNGRYVEQC
jgi:hypothetical protein